MKQATNNSAFLHFLELKDFADDACAKTSALADTRPRGNPVELRWHDRQLAVRYRFSAQALLDASAAARDCGCYTGAQALVARYAAHEGIAFTMEQNLERFDWRSEIYND